MKWTARILIAIVFLLAAGLLTSNMLLKKEYDKLDKSDTYWTYEKITQQHFKYLKVEGGNLTKIAFEQSNDCSVRVLNEWQRYHPKLIEASVNNDTLYIKFIHVPKDMGEKSWMKWTTLVRIFSPELLYVEGFDTRLEMFKLKQKSITVNMSGKSSFEVESMVPDLDSLNISQKDSSEVVFEMSPEYKLPVTEEDKPAIKVAQIAVGQAPLIINNNNAIKSNESMRLQSLTASVLGNSLLDIGHAQINSIKLDIADSSGIILSGGALRKLHQQ